MKTGRNDLVQLNVRVPKLMWKDLQEQAKEQNFTFNFWITKILEDHLIDSEGR